VSQKFSRKAGRVVRYTRKDGTKVEKRYATWQPKPSIGNGDTIGDLIAAWQQSPRWNKLADSSKDGYTRALRHLSAVARVRAGDLVRRDLLSLRDAIVAAHGPGAARDFVTAVGSLWAWAIDYEWNVQPGASRRLLKDLPKGELPAWTIEETRLALQHLPERLRRAVILALHTGQRRSDLIAMHWSDYDGATIPVVQEKTGAKLIIPVVPELMAELDAWKPALVDLAGTPLGTILLTDAGESWTDTNLSAQMNIYLKKVPGFPQGRNIHGVRYLAAASLAQAGCTVHEIMSITGHKTIAMVQKYTQAVDQAKAAQAAVAKLVEHRAKTA
jgi:integrase